MRMLAEPLTIEDAIARGVETSEPDGRRVAIADATYAFVILEAEAGVARKVLAGPFYPDDDERNQR